jgi:hypothetical protein
MAAAPAAPARPGFPYMDLAICAPVALRGSGSGAEHVDGLENAHVVRRQA